MALPPVERGVSRRHRKVLAAVRAPDPVPPVIEALPASAARPLFSVMIPTFNCAEYLRVCLQSVLQQDLGPELMQIEVIDDCSTLDDPKAVVDELGGGRVFFTRQARNVGAVENFNTCIRRATGQLVHILHGDDFVLDGFYTAIAEHAADHPTAGMYATRVRFVDESGSFGGNGSSLDALGPGVSHTVEAFEMGTPLQFAGTVVRRGAYEELGGFLPGLVHVADWEMWIRVVASRGIAAVSEPLAAYRVFDSSHTSGLVRTAENLADLERGLRVVQQRGIAVREHVVLLSVRRRAQSQAYRLAKAGDSEAVLANLRFWRARATPVDRVRRLLGTALRWVRREATG